MIKRVLAVVLAFALVLSVTGCKSEKKEKGPEATLDAFQEAFNRYDMDGMLNCVDQTMSDIVRALLDSEGKNYSVSHMFVFALIKMGFPLLPLLTHGSIENDDLPKLSLEYGAATVSGDKASVPTEGTLTLGDGSLSFRVTVKLKRDEDGKWLISGLEKAQALDEKLTETLDEKLAA